MTYESGKKTRILGKDLHRLGKALARGSGYKSIADAVMDSADLRKSIEDRICSDVNNECKKLCSKKVPSLLRTTTKDSVLNFSWQNVMRELSEKAPVFYRLLLASCDYKSILKSGLSNNDKYPGICAAAAILLKKRDKCMSLVPYVISLTLKVGKTSKRVSCARTEVTFSVKQ